MRKKAIWIHAIWATKHRQNLLVPKIRQIVYTHIINNCRKKNIKIEAINGTSNHIHILFLYTQEQELHKIIQLLKGESSFWINKSKLTPVRFQWQKGYYDVRIPKSRVDVVKEYINNQEEHHKSKTFTEEFAEFIKENGFYTG